MLYRVIISAILSLVVSLSAIAAEPLRVTYNLNDGWNFYLASDVDGKHSDRVSLPHTWNPACSEGGYLRTSANYSRELVIPAEWQGRRLFLRFGGVQSVADVFVNGGYVGSHEGGFTAFTMEITDKVKFGASNYVRVMVSNAMRSDVLPVSSDMDLAGGIYRDVELLVTNRNIISPLHYSSDGVYVVQKSVTEERVEGVVRLYLAAAKEEHLQLVMRIIGPDGYEVVERSVKVAKILPERGVEIPFEIENPVLWSPQSPAMYSIEVSVVEEGATVDCVVVNAGFRSITINDDNRLCINGEPVSVRGVNLPHTPCEGGKAYHCGAVDHDFDLIEDMGANAIRSLYGPHPETIYDYCDKMGLLAWVDMPFSRSPLSMTDICYFPSLQFRDNGLMQLNEIIAQNFNHPSVVMWGLFEQVWQRGEDIVAYVRELNDCAHRLDPSRPTVGCSSTDGDINFVTDLIVFRQSVGYMKGSVEDVAVWCRQLSSNGAWRTMRYGVCYGEEGNTEHRTESIERAQRGTRFNPERRQTYMHERYSDIISEADIFWGVWLNSMFDYASSRRAGGVNYSGIVGSDRRTKKDAYYLYRALWNDVEPTLYISDRRWTERCDTLQHINIYSSVGEPTVMVDGDTVAVRRVARGQYRADSLTLRGRVNILAADSVGEHSDRLELCVGGYVAY